MHESSGYNCIFIIFMQIAHHNAYCVLIKPIGTSFRKHNARLQFWFVKEYERVL